MFNNKFKDILLDSNLSIAWGMDNCLYGSGYDYYGALSSNGEAYPKVRNITQISISDIKQIFASQYHTFYLKNDGTVLSFGNKYNGNLGIKQSETKKFENLLNIPNIKDIYAGDRYTILLTEDNILYASGYNRDGQLGLEDTNNRDEFTQIPFDGTNIKKISCYACHTLILKNDGTVYASGLNSHGQLGLGHTNNQTTFVQIPGISDVKDIYCGQLFSIILKNDGTVWACGSCHQYQFGLSAKDHLNFTKVATDVQQLLGCGYHTMLLKNDRTVWASGYNSSKRFGAIDNLKVYTQIATNVKKIYGGDAHTFLVKNDDTIWACGHNTDGRCAISNYIDVLPDFQQVTEIDNVNEILCGGYHTIFKKNDGTYWGCGNNESNRIGILNANKYQTFAKINIDNIKDVKYDVDDNGHLAVLKTDGTLWACGNNQYNNAVPEIDGTVTVLTQIADNVKDFWISEYNTYILKNDNSLWSCGGNFCGEAGLPESSGPYEDDSRIPFTKIMDNVDIKTLYLSDNYMECTRMLKTDGTLWCTGWNDYNFGITTLENYYGFRKTQENVKEIFPCANYSFILKEDNTLWTCGRAYNYNADSNCLGLGDTRETALFTKIEGMDNVKTLQGAYNQTVAVKNDGTVWTCGDNYNGELGLGDFNNRKIFTKVNLNNVIDAHLSINGGCVFIIYVCEDGLYFSGQNAGFLKNEDIGTKHPVPTLIDIDEKINTKDIKNIKINYQEIAVIMKNGDAFYCGLNGSCNSGLPNNIGYNAYYIKGLTKYKHRNSTNDNYYIKVNDEIIKITDTRTNSENIMIVKDENNNVYMQDENDEFNKIETNNSVKDIHCGNNHIVYLDDQNDLYAKGSNNKHQLGLNDIDEVNEFTKINENTKYARAVKNLTIIEKDNQIYVTGEDNNGFTPYEF